MKLLLATNEGLIIKTFEDLENINLDSGMARAALAVEVLKAIKDHRKKKTIAMPVVKD